jgi:hypothetical protein
LGAESIMIKSDNFAELHAATRHLIEKWLHLACNEHGGSCTYVGDGMGKSAPPF